MFAFLRQKTGGIRASPCARLAARSKSLLFQARREHAYPIVFHPSPDSQFEICFLRSLQHGPAAAKSGAERGSNWCDATTSAFPLCMSALVLRVSLFE